MTDLRTRLREAAGKATKGEWAVRRSKIAVDGAFDYAISAEGATVLAEAFGRGAKGEWLSSEANADHIALCSPDNILALLDAHQSEITAAYRRGIEAAAERVLTAKAHWTNEGIATAIRALPDEETKL